MLKKSSNYNNILASLKKSNFFVANITLESLMSGLLEELNKKNQSNS